MRRHSDQHGWQGAVSGHIFIERLWRSLKYEEVYIKAYGSVPEARRNIGDWLAFYHGGRLYQALVYWTPREVFEGEACEHRQDKEVIMH